jgi:hypothetical protein
MRRIQEMGREDAVKVLQSGCSIYRIITLEESMSLPVLESNAESSLTDVEDVEQHQNGAS